MNEEEFKREFQTKFVQLSSEGLSQNDAAAAALSHVMSLQRSGNTGLHTQLVQGKEQSSLSSTKLQHAVKEAQSTQSYRAVLDLIYNVFSNSDELNRSFLLVDSSSVDDNTCDSGHSFGINLFEARAAFEFLLGTNDERILNTLQNALDTLVTQSWGICGTWNTAESIRQFLILFSHPSLLDPTYRRIVGGICKLLYYVPDTAKQLLKQEWIQNTSKDSLRRLLDILQQHITLRLYSGEPMDTVFAAAASLKMLIEVNDETGFADYSDFHNDVVNSEINLIKDYAQSSIYRKRTRQMEANELNEMSFCEFPFLLDAASKARILQIDSDFQKRTEFHGEIARNYLTGHVNPYLLLRVRRDTIVSDTMQQLAHVPPDALKKPLKVKFVGEEGIDEGGVQKEFFQVILRQLLDPAYGMFKYDNETRTMWFNSDSLEASMEFELIGQLIGIAIYNTIILDLHFPAVVYRKLIDHKATLQDLQDSQPELSKGLKELLSFKGDVEQIFALTFEISYEVFGAIKNVELVPGGKAMVVTNENRRQYVEAYVNYLLNTSVQKQFDAFYNGFHQVCGGDALKLFQPEELELLICGSPDFDFDALEQVTLYDNGYTAESECIRHFWSVVHALPLDSKKKLLMFTTGSDRIPIRGLSTMTFVISRNGPDSDRLPTAHTCFNHLLLPEYSSRDKLEQRLLIAIEQSEGFGLL